MTDQNKHIEKLKKLLALAASGNPHEAALALRRARKLMDVHGITHSDIAMSDIDETISHYWPTGSLRPPRYMLGLMNIIREVFGVNSIIHPARIRLWGSTATGNVRHWLHTPGKCWPVS